MKGLPGPTIWAFGAGGLGRQYGAAQMGSRSGRWVGPAGCRADPVEIDTVTAGAASLRISPHSQVRDKALEISLTQLPAERVVLLSLTARWIWIERASLEDVDALRRG
ncbi:unnamed protein product [Cuscuta campestris]|uniref:Uncharacterized protein n=1 Tax=Cuscuta campestris TaxID=132261 RepID=A0A484MAS1_9ASTE|nr:unnamed protein product [Cuscuta campestris]